MRTVETDIYITPDHRYNVRELNGTWQLIEEKQTNNRWMFHRFETRCPPKVTEVAARNMIPYFLEEARVVIANRKEWLASFVDVEYPAPLREGRKPTSDYWPKRLPPVWEPGLFHVDIPEYGPVLGLEWVKQGGLRVNMDVRAQGDGQQWLHVSFRRRDRLPDWGELREVKELFIGEDRYAIQVLPPADEYVNLSPYSLHLFCCLGGHPLPSFFESVGGRK